MNFQNNYLKNNFIFLFFRFVKLFLSRSRRKNMASHYRVEAKKKSEQSKRAAFLLEFKLNNFFERQVEQEQDLAKFLETTLQRLRNAQVLFFLEQLNATQFNCTREVLGKRGQIDQFIITFKIMEETK